MGISPVFPHCFVGKRGFGMVKRRKFIQEKVFLSLLYSLYKMEEYIL